MTAGRSTDQPPDSLAAVKPRSTDSVPARPVRSEQNGTGTPDQTRIGGATYLSLSPRHALRMRGISGRPLRGGRTPLGRVTGERRRGVRLPGVGVRAESAGDPLAVAVVEGRELAGDDAGCLVHLLGCRGGVFVNEQSS
jgi:hypothetical protein